MNPRILSLSLLALSLGVAEPAAAQPTQVHYHVVIRGRDIPLQELGERGGTEYLPLRWTHLPRIRRDTTLRTGMEIQRTRRIGTGAGAVDITYSDTVRESDLRIVSHGTAPVLPGRRATISPDKNDPSRLNVNFWIPAGPITWIDDDSATHTLTPEEARGIDYYYQLRNRQTVKFPYRAWSVGAVSIPFRWRPGYRASNGVDVPGTFTATSGVALYAGKTFGSVRYTYLRNGESTLDRRYAITAGGFVGLSAAEVDSAVSLSAVDPVRSKRSVAVISPGLTVLTTVRGIEFGAFGGIDYAPWGVGPRWDFHARPWIGVGVGFNAWKI